VIGNFCLTRRDEFLPAKTQVCSILRVPTPTDKIAATEQIQPRNEHPPLPTNPAAPIDGDISPFNFPQHAAAIEDRMLDADWREFFNSRQTKRSNNK
jgi:hypothetical protein